MRPPYRDPVDDRALLLEQLREGDLVDADFAKGIAAWPAPSFFQPGRCRRRIGTPVLEPEAHPVLFEQIDPDGPQPINGRLPIVLTTSDILDYLLWWRFA